MSLLEYFWRESYQIVMLTPNTPYKDADICGWGSGFIIKYRNRLFFVTCDHNLHMNDYEGDEKRTGNDYGVAIICNTNSRKGTVNIDLLTVTGFNYFESYDFNLPEIPDLKDIAFAELSEPLPCPILTHRLTDYDGSTIVVKEGLPKLNIDERCFNDYPNETKEYVVTGCIENKIVNGCLMERKNVFHEGIKHTGQRYLDSFDVYENPIPIEQNFWAGLSGSPIFDSDGQLVGMINKVLIGGKNSILLLLKVLLNL